VEPSEGSHPDPTGQASAAAGQKIAELAAVAAMLGQVAAQIKARQASRAADAVARDEAALAAARTGWAPALHPEWLADATLRNVATAWGSAAPWEHADSGAQAALEACETRLRELHPYAMRRFDELRGRGWARADAMMDAAQAFALHPSPRPAPQDANDGRYLAAAAPSGGGPVQAPAGPFPVDPDAAVTSRILRIVARLNEQATAAGRGPLDPEVVDIALRTGTNAPDALIRNVVDGLRAGTRVVPTVAAAAGPRSAASAGVNAATWPSNVYDGVAAATIGRSVTGQRRPAARAGRRPPSPGHGPRLSP
jgi:hypothetical protein